MARVALRQAIPHIEANRHCDWLGPLEHIITHLTRIPVLIRPDDLLRLAMKGEERLYRFSVAEFSASPSFLRSCWLRGGTSCHACHEKASTPVGPRRHGVSSLHIVAGTKGQQPPAVSNDTTRSRQPRSPSRQHLSQAAHRRSPKAASFIGRSLILSGVGTGHHTFADIRRVALVCRRFNAVASDVTIRPISLHAKHR